MQFLRTLRGLVGFGILLSVLSWVDPVIAAENQGESSHEQESASEKPEQSKQKPRPVSRVRSSRDQETEGTQAPNQFNTDLIIKSRYKLNGQELEVDTD